MSEHIKTDKEIAEDTMPKVLAGVYNINKPVYYIFLSWLKEQIEEYENPYVGIRFNQRDYEMVENMRRWFLSLLEEKQ